MTRPRSATLLGAEEIARLKREPLTYAEVGHTASSPPPGYSSLTRTVIVPVERDLSSLALDLFSWQVPLRAGLSVAASSPAVEKDAVVVMRIGLLPLQIPCRVVYVIDEADRKGFAYGTLSGHPESGEEAFILTRRPDGRISFAVSAFSRPATRLAQLGGPLTTAMQRYMTSRYLGSLSGPSYQ